MALETILKDRVKDAVGDIIDEEIQEIVVNETRRALRERETEITAVIKTAVAAAIAELLNGVRP